MILSLIGVEGESHRLLGVNRWLSSDAFYFCLSDAFINTEVSWRPRPSAIRS
jgi:hypothetical protein